MRTNMFDPDSYFSGESIREARIRAGYFRRRGIPKADESRVRDSARHVAARYGRYSAGMGV